MRRLFIDECLSEDITIKGDDAKHLLYAMRVRPEQVFTIVDKESKVIEYSLLRAYETKDGEVNAVIYSQRFDYDANIKDNKKMINEINKNVEKRMKDIFEIDFKIFG